jgi:uncharacterized protein Yka (UPF0111/DUF47 family)
MTLADNLRKIKGWRLLPPRDKEFYDLFNELSSTIVESSELLILLFESFQADRGEIEVRISTALTRCDRIAESIEALLQKAQQPPFDRAEISQLIEDMVRIIKYIGHAANRYVVYDFPSSDKEMRELAPIINEACREIAKAVNSLERNRNLDPFFKAVDLLETKADHIYHEGLRRRFQEIRRDRQELEERVKALPPSPSPELLLPIIIGNTEYTRHTAIFFILRQVYAELERSIDACSDATATLKRMVAKNV